MALPTGVSKDSIRAVYETLAADVRLDATQLDSYTANFVDYAAYATPTDLFTIQGAADKIIRITSFRLLMHSTAAALQRITFIKRSTLNTGGTPTTVTGIPVSSRFGAHSATLKLFGAAPTLGTEVGKVAYQLIASAVATSAPGIINMFAPFPATSAVTYGCGVELVGANECLCINYGGGALTAGANFYGDIVWSEETV